MGQTASISTRRRAESVANSASRESAQNPGGSTTTAGTGNDPGQSSTATLSGHKRSDLRWSRVSMSQLYDETFLAKEFKRFETLNASFSKQTATGNACSANTGKSSRGLGQTPLQLHLLTRKPTMKARKEQEDNLLDNPSNALGGTPDVNDSMLWSYDDPNNSSNLSDEEKQHLEIQREQELLNRLFLLSDLSQPQIVMFMVTKLRQQIAHNCTVSNAFDEFLDFRQLLLGKMMDSMQFLQENHIGHLRNTVAMNQMVQQALDKVNANPSTSRFPISSSSTRGLATSSDSSLNLLTGSSTSNGSGFMKSKDKATREAALGVNVLLWMLDTLLHDQIATVYHKRDVLMETAPLIQQLAPLALVSKSKSTCSQLKPFYLMAAQRSISSTTANPVLLTHPSEAFDLLESLQRFLIECCTAFGSSSSDLDEKTLAMNCILHLAAARGSLKDFLVAIKVLLVIESSTSQQVTADCDDENAVVTRSAGNVLTMKQKMLDADPQEIDEEVAEAVRFTESDQSTAEHLQQKMRILLEETSELREQSNLREVGIQPKKKSRVKSAKQQQQQQLQQQQQQQHQQQQQQQQGVGLHQQVVLVPVNKKDDIQALTTLASLSTDLSEDSSAQFPRRRTSIPKLAPSPSFKPLHVVTILKELNDCRATSISGAPGICGSPTRAACSRSRASGSRMYSDCWNANVNLNEDDEDEPEVWSCGQNSYGELGHGDTTTRKAFERVEALLHKDIVQVCAGNEHTIALSSDGQVFTCGYNDNGQCGLGVSTRISQMTGLTRLPNDQVVSQIHAYNGCEHTILVTQDGRAATFGYNYRGQLGHGNTTSEFLPKFLRGFETRRVLLVSCSYYHTIMSVCEGNGSKQSVYSFGRNDYGQLGHNDTLDRKFPQQIEWFNQPGDGNVSTGANGNPGVGSSDSFGYHVVSLACGQYHTMVVTANGRVIGFGKNDYGQLGLETLENQLIPMQVTGNGLEKLTALEVRCGYYHTIVLCNGAHLYGFGRNDYGQLGLGKPNATASANLQMQQQRFASPQLIEELENKEIARFACGCYHTIAVSESGMLYVFGRNNHGQLGTGDTVERTYPFGIDTFMGKHVVMVAAGFYHTMVLTGSKHEEPCDSSATVMNDTDGVESTNASIEASTSFHVVLEDPYFQCVLGNLPPVSAANVQNHKHELDDFEGDREEDDDRRRNGRVPSMVTPVVQPTTVNSVDAAILLLAHLDRLSRPFTPKRGIYPSMQNANPQALQSLLNAKRKVDFAESIEGCYQPYAIQVGRGTFETLLAIIQHLVARRSAAFERPRGSSLSDSSAATDSPRANTQVYALCACFRILQANLVQLIRSGLGQIVLIVGNRCPRGTETNTNPNLHEIVDIASSLAKLRDELMSLLSKKRNSLCGGELSEDYERKVMDETMETLMLGLELFFPCKCSQAQLLFGLLDLQAKPVGTEQSLPECSCCSCGWCASTKSKACRRWQVLAYRKMTFVDFLLRRMAEDSLLAKYIPIEHGIDDSMMETTAVAASKPSQTGSMYFIRLVYCALLEKITHDTSRALEEVTKNSSKSANFRSEALAPPPKDLKKTGSWSKPRTTVSGSEIIGEPMVSVLIGIQKHLASWALQTKRWKCEFGNLKYDQGIWLQQLVQNVFRVTPQSHSSRVPSSWKCFVEFCVEVLSQSVALLVQIQGKQSDRLATTSSNSFTNDPSWMNFLGSSVVNKLLPSLVACLMLFSELPVFVITLLPFIKEIARVLQLLNAQHEQQLREVEQEFLFKGAGGSSSTTSTVLGDITTGISQSGSTSGANTKPGGSLVTDSCLLPWNFRLHKELVILATKMNMTLISGDALFDWSEDLHRHQDLASSRATKTNPFCTRWLEKSRLFHGGLLSRVIRDSLNTSTSPPTMTSGSLTRIVQHTPLTTEVQVKLSSGSHFALHGITWNGIEHDFFVILPPPSASSPTICDYGNGVAPANDARTNQPVALSNNHEQNSTETPASAYCIHSLENYLRMVELNKVRAFLLCMTGAVAADGKDTTAIPLSFLYRKAQSFCSWIREVYAKTDASYRMILRQLTQKSKLPQSTTSTSLQSVQMELQMENAMFATLLYHEGLTIPAFHFAMTRVSNNNTASPPPLAFRILWKLVAEMTRSFSNKKMLVKNASTDPPTASVGDASPTKQSPTTAEVETTSAADQIAGLQQALLLRCELLLQIMPMNHHHSRMPAQHQTSWFFPAQDMWSISSCHEFQRISPPVAPSSGKGEEFHRPISISASSSALYSSHNLPFLRAFPRSRWKRVRMRFHVMVRWKSFVKTSRALSTSVARIGSRSQSTSRLGDQSETGLEILEFVTDYGCTRSQLCHMTFELLDRCRRASTRTMGLRGLMDLFALFSFDSMKADCLNQLGNGFLQTKLLSASQNLYGIGAFYADLLYNAQADCMELLMQQLRSFEVHLPTLATLPCLLSVLKCWGIDLHAHWFEIVDEVQLLRVLRRISNQLVQLKSPLRALGSNGSQSDLTRSLDGTNSNVLSEFKVNQLQETLWSLFRLICCQFAVQTLTVDGKLLVPVTPSLVESFDVLYEDAQEAFQKSLLTTDSNKLSDTADPARPSGFSSQTSSQSSRRSVEIISSPQKISFLSKGLDFYVSEQGLTAAPPSGVGNVSASNVAPTLTCKASEFSISSWLFLQSSSAMQLQNNCLVFFRGSVNQMAPFVLLVGEKGVLQLEVGVLIVVQSANASSSSLNAGVSSGKDRHVFLERLVSKTIMPLNKWIHIAIVHEAAKLRLYVNGILDNQRVLPYGSLPFEFTLSPNLPFHFGRVQGGSNGVPVQQGMEQLETLLIGNKLGIFDGFLAHFRFHHRCLSPIHVRIGFDEKKPLETSVGDQLLYEICGVLMPLAGASEAVIHLTSAKWLSFLWTVFLSGSFRVQQALLRVFRGLFGVLTPAQVTEMLFPDQKKSDLWGFLPGYPLVIQQLVRLLGFSVYRPSLVFEAPADTSEIVVLPSHLGFPVQILNGKSQHQWKESTDVLGNGALTNEVALLLQFLYLKEKTHWHKPIHHTIEALLHQATVVNTQDLPPKKLFQINDVFVSQHELVQAQAMGCLYTMNGIVEFLRVGATSELVETGEIAKVLSLNVMHSTAVAMSNEDPSKTPPESRLVANLVFCKRMHHATQEVNMQSPLPLSPRGSCLFESPHDGARRQLPQYSYDGWYEQLANSGCQSIESIVFQLNSEQLRSSNAFGTHEDGGASAQEALGGSFLCPTNTTNTMTASVVETATPLIAANCWFAFDERLLDWFEAIHSNSKPAAPSSPCSPAEECSRRVQLLYLSLQHCSSLKSISQMVCKSSGALKLLRKPTLVEKVLELALQSEASEPKSLEEESLCADVAALMQGGSFGLVELEQWVWMVRRKLHQVQMELREQLHDEISKLSECRGQRRKLSVRVESTCGSALVQDPAQSREGVEDLLDLKQSWTGSNSSRVQAAEEFHDQSPDDSMDLPRAEPISGEDDLEDPVDDEDGDEEEDAEEEEGDEEEDEDAEEEDDDEEEEGEEEEGDEEEDEDASSRQAYVEELMLMGFPEDWCVMALKQTENDIVGASAWIVDNLEYLSKLQNSLDKQREAEEEEAANANFSDEEDDQVVNDSAVPSPGDSIQDPNDAQASSGESKPSARQLYAQKSDKSINISASTASKSSETPPHVASSVSIPRSVENGGGIVSLNEKEMARKVFGEMYFPFEEGGFEFNTQNSANVNNSTRSVTVGAAVLNSASSFSSNATASSAQPVPSWNSLLPKLQRMLEQMDFASLFATLISYEKQLQILFARQILCNLCCHFRRKPGATSMTSTSKRPTSASTLSTDQEELMCQFLRSHFVDYLGFLKLVLLRGQYKQLDALAIVNGRLQQTSLDKVMKQALQVCFFHEYSKANDSQQQQAQLSEQLIEFCVQQMEKATTNKKYEALLWTQRDLNARRDKEAMEEPCIELASWLLNVFVGRILQNAGEPLACGSRAYSPRSLSTQMMTKTLSRMKKCLVVGTNLPLKCIVLHGMSRLVSCVSDLSTRKQIIIDAQLRYEEFLHAAYLRQMRETVQHRLLFSLYLQAYVEILLLLKPLVGVDASTWRVSGSTADLLELTKANPNSKAVFMFDRKRCKSALLQYSDDGLSVTYNGSECWKTVVATQGFVVGQCQWQVRIDKSSSSYLFVGIASQRANLDSFLGADDFSWGFIGDKGLYHQRNRVRTYGETFGEGDVIGIQLDCEKGTLSFSKNGNTLGIAFENVVGQVFPAVAFYSRHQKVSFLKEGFEGNNSTSHLWANALNESVLATASRPKDSMVDRAQEPPYGSIQECLVACEIMHSLSFTQQFPRLPATTSKPSLMDPGRSSLEFTPEILDKAFDVYRQWAMGKQRFVPTKAGYGVWVETDEARCVEVAGVRPNEKVRTPRGNGIVLGVLENRAWVELEGETPLHGCWFCHPSKVRSLVGIGAATEGSDKIPSNIALNADAGAGHSSTAATNADPGAGSASIMSREDFMRNARDSRWKQQFDPVLVKSLNDFCEKATLSKHLVWNLSIQETLDVVRKGGTTSSSSTSASDPFQSQLHAILHLASNVVIARLALVRLLNLLLNRRLLAFFDCSWHYFAKKTHSTSSLLPVQLLSQARHLVFWQIKSEFVDLLMLKTATMPRKAEDDYDYPSELPQLVVNRARAACARNGNKTLAQKLPSSLFGQSFEQLHFLPNKQLRMVYSHPMDDTQLRCFKVKFEGEGVDDYGGPYREFFSQFFMELQMLQEPAGSSASSSASSPEGSSGSASGSSQSIARGAGTSTTPSTMEPFLPLLLPSPNWRNGVGSSREKFVLNGQLLGMSHDDIFAQMFVFFGQMLGICIRTRVCVRLDLATYIWKQLVNSEDKGQRDDGDGGDKNQEEEEEHEIDDPEDLEAQLSDLKEIDFVCFQLVQRLQTLRSRFQRATSQEEKASLAMELEAMDLSFTTFLSDGTSVELVANGSEIPVTMHNVGRYLRRMVHTRWKENQKPLALIKKGLSMVLPVTCLHVLTWQELESRVVGSEDIDVELLRANTEYDEDIHEKDEFVQRFWRVLSAMEPSDKTAFLRFVWARSRLPVGGLQFHQKFKIQAATASSSTPTTMSGSPNAASQAPVPAPSSSPSIAASQPTAIVTSVETANDVTAVLNDNASNGPSTSGAVPTSTTSTPPTVPASASNLAPTPPSASAFASSSSSSSSSLAHDMMLPKSHTCFFALQLPRYSSDAICRKQILYAIHNCVEMDGDFRLADTELTGWSEINPHDALRF